MFIDPDGRQALDPGDRFKRLRSAAIDFGKKIQWVIDQL